MLWRLGGKYRQFREMMHSALKLTTLNGKPVIAKLTTRRLRTLSPCIDMGTVMGLALIL